MWGERVAALPAPRSPHESGRASTWSSGRVKYAPGHPFGRKIKGVGAVPPDLCGHDDLSAGKVGDRPSQRRLRLGVPVERRGVEEVDSPLEGEPECVRACVRACVREWWWWWWWACQPSGSSIPTRPPFSPRPRRHRGRRRPTATPRIPTQRPAVPYCPMAVSGSSWGTITVNSPGRSRELYVVSYPLN